MSGFTQLTLLSKEGESFTVDVEAAKEISKLVLEVKRFFYTCYPFPSMNSSFSSLCYLCFLCCPWFKFQSNFQSLEDDDDSSPELPIANVKAVTLKKIVDFMIMYKNAPLKDGELKKKIDSPDFKTVQHSLVFSLLFLHFLFFTFVPYLYFVGFD